MIFYTIFVVLLEKEKKSFFLSLGGRFPSGAAPFVFSSSPVIVPKTNVNSLYFFPLTFGLSESVLFTCTEKLPAPLCVRRDPRLGEVDPHLTPPASSA